MARSDWAIMSGSADGTSWGGVTILRNATFGITPPPGGGAAVFGINSVQNVIGAVAVYNAVAGFSPLPSGGSISMVLKRGISGGLDKFSAFLFLCATGNNIGDSAYLIGLSDTAPSRIIVAKGAVGVGLPGDGVGTKILRQSTRTVEIDEYVHLKIDAIVQGSGDVVLRFYENDLDLHPLDNPASWVWVPIPCTDEWVGQFSDGYFIDDVVGVNSGSTPLTSGYAGYGGEVKDAARRSYYDHAILIAQA